jgi:hypothetical protein
VRVLIDPNDRRSGTAILSFLRRRLRSARCSQRAERLAAATETMNPIAMAMALQKAQGPAPVLPEQIRLASVRLSLTRGAPGKLSGTAAKLRRLLCQLLLPPATLRRIVSSRFYFRRSSRWSELVQEMPVAATEIKSQFEVGWRLAWERLPQHRNRVASGIGLGTEARSRRSLFLLLFAACHCSPHCFMMLSARVVAAVPSKIAAASTD